MTHSMAPARAHTRHRSMWGTSTAAGSSRARVAAMSALTAGMLVLSGCSPEEPRVSTTVPPATSTPAQATPEPTPQPAVDPATLGPVTPTGETAVIATGLDLPWSMVRLDSGSTLVSERDTALVKEVGPDLAVREVGRVTNVVPGGEGGLLGLAVLTDDLTTWLYAYTTTASDNRVVRMPLSGEPGGYALGASEVVFSGIPKAGNHNGGRIKFGPDGMLYITAGDAGVPERAQNVGELGGKILRVTPQGAVPEDNPFPGNPVYSFGHRNPQGLDWDRDGRLWAAEFGQNTWDELNVVDAGANYGWPVVEGIGANPAYRDPIYQWSTAEASPSGLLFTRDTFFLAALRGEALWSITPEGNTVTATPHFVGEFGRVRDVIEGANGSLWILTNNTGRAPRDGDDKIVEVRLGALEKG
jgi:glucose/arabinose dehydrogenase